ncbi:MAG: ankyrin repeat domain-containing protein, partial [Planctomycetota bacterium]
DYFPLHAAAGAGELELCQMLVDHGADVNARVGSGDRPIDWATSPRITAYLRRRGASPADPAVAGPSRTDWLAKPNANQRGGNPREVATP